MPVRLITPATQEPVTLEAIKADLRVDFADQDALIQRNITVAREWVERRVQTKFAVQTWELVLDGFPDANIELPFGPVRSITSIKYDDAALVEQTLATANYRLGGSVLDFYVVPVVAWPATATHGSSVRVRFVAGYDFVTQPQTEFVPETIKAAITLKVRELYDGEDLSAPIHNLITNHLRLEA